MGSDDLRAVIGRLASLTDLDLLSEFDSGHKADARDREIERTRAALPNRVLRGRFDRYLQADQTRINDRGREHARRNRKRAADLQRKFDRLHQLGTAPKLIPVHLFKMAQHLIADSTGTAAAAYARSCPHKIGVSLARRAALAADATGPRYSFAGTDRGACRARRVLAAGLLLLGLSARTGRRRDRWGRIVKGIPQTAILACLADPSTRARPSRTGLAGIHRAGNPLATGGNVGYLKALRNGGLLYSRQARWREGGTPTTRGWSDLTPNEIADRPTDSGWRVSYNRYWLVTDQFASVRDADEKARLWLAWLDGQLPEPEREPTADHFATETAASLPAAADSS